MLLKSNWFSYITHGCNLINQVNKGNCKKSTDNIAFLQRLKDIYSQNALRWKY